MSTPIVLRRRSPAERLEYLAGQLGQVLDNDPIDRNRLRSIQLALMTAAEPDEARDLPRTGPLVSVLLTSYNRGAMLSRAIASVLTQDMADFELLLLDDNSPGGSYTRQVIGRQADPRIWVIQSRVTRTDRPRTARYATMINHGLRFARGRYIAYLCDDDWYLPGRLLRMTAWLGSHPEQSVIYGTQLLVDHRGDPIGERPAAIRFDPGGDHDPAYQIDHNSVMHTATAARDAGGWDDDPTGLHLADARYWRRLLAAGHSIHPMPGPPTEAHRHHPGGLGQAPADENLIIERSRRGDRLV